MKPWVKATIAVLSHLPGAYILFYMSFFIWMLTQISHARVTAAHLPLVFLFLAHLLVIVALLGFCLLWLLKGSGFSLERKLLWAVGLLFMAPVTMPLLYWVYLRNIAPGPYILGKPWTGRTWLEELHG